MATEWKQKYCTPISLSLDRKNPRLGREYTSRAPREIMQYLFEHDKAFEVAKSIASHGFFLSEPLLAIEEDGKTVVVEGNRRLAALKALREPALLSGKYQKQVERLVRNMSSPQSIERIPVVFAPSRKAADRQIAVRHGGTPVLAWKPENRASFILDKLEEGYNNDTLRDELGFSSADIQQARQTRAIADMARSASLPDEVMAKIGGPGAKVFTTLERVLSSSVGRSFFHITPDPNHGVRISTGKKEFSKAFAKLVSDIALGKQTSRSLNKNENIQSYFNAWESSDKPKKHTATFVPSELISGKTVASIPDTNSTPKKPVRSTSSSTVIPRAFKARYGGERIQDLVRELKKLKREEYPNAGAVLLRVFLELSILDYLSRAGKLNALIQRLKAEGKLRHTMPTLSQTVAEIKDIAKTKLKGPTMNKIAKALSHDNGVPFSVGDLNSFVHDTDIPGARDILQFWDRTEALFVLMLTDEIESI